MGNRVSHIVELIAPDHWGHVEGLRNPANSTSRGLLPSELLDHPLWWTGPDWLKCDMSDWPKQIKLTPNIPVEDGDEVCLHALTSCPDPIIPVDRYSSFTHLKRITAWAIRFISNCRMRKNNLSCVSSFLTASEPRQAEYY